MFTVIERIEDSDGALSLVEIQCKNWRLMVEHKGWLTSAPTISLKATYGVFGREWCYVWPFYRQTENPPEYCRVLEIESPPVEWLELVQLPEEDQKAAAISMLGKYQDGISTYWYRLPLTIRLSIEALAGQCETEESLLLAERPFIPSASWMPRFFELLNAPSLLTPKMSEQLAGAWKTYKRFRVITTASRWSVSSRRTEESPTLPEQEQLALVCWKLLSSRDFRRSGRKAAISAYLNCLYPTYRKTMAGYGVGRLQKLKESLVILETGKPLE